MSTQITDAQHELVERRIEDVAQKVQEHGEDIAVLKNNMNFIKYVARATLVATITTLIKVFVG